MTVYVSDVREISQECDGGVGRLQDFDMEVLILASECEVTAVSIQLTSLCPSQCDY